MSRGLGRAVLHLNPENAPLYRTSLLEACLHDERWDRQIEDGRAPYLLEALRATGEPEWYAAHLRVALLVDDDSCDIGQIFALSVALTEANFADLRPALYVVFARYAERGDELRADDLIRLDGYAGYTFIAKCFASHPLPENQYYVHHLLLNDVIERDGLTETRQFTAQLMESEPNVAEYLKRTWQDWEEWQNEVEQRRKRPRKSLDYEAIKAQIESPDNSIRDWGRYADEATFLRLAEDMMHESDPHRLKKYLRQFYKRTFPLDPAVLIEIARRDDREDNLPQRALNALKRITHPAVRAFAVESIRTLGMEWRGVGLLAKNPAPGDIAIIESLLARYSSLPADEYHHIGFGVRDYFEAHPTPDAVPSLTLLYEHGPCSLCRNHCVEMLLAQGTLPQWMREECRYDANANTRKIGLNLSNLAAQ